MKTESSPLARAMIIENEVSGTSRGRILSTCAKTCESVMTSAGGSLSASRVSRKRSAVQDEGAAAVVEDVADYLHLRQYEAAFRGLYVLRRYEDDFRAGGRRGRP